MENINNAEMVLIGIGEEFQNNENALTAYNNLADKLDGKNYFIITLCDDDMIFSSKLNPERIVAPVGTKMKKQCPDGCNDELYDMTESVCSCCGKELVFNTVSANKYVEKGYLPQWQKHRMWLTGTLNKKLLVLELGVSLKYPQIIRWPFEKIVELNLKSEFIRVNEKLPHLSENVVGRGTSVKQSSVEWLLSI